MVLFAGMQIANGQTIYDWQATAPDGNFSASSGASRWYDNIGTYYTTEPPAGGILRFDNNIFINNTNNITGTYNLHQLIFATGATSGRTITNSGTNAFRFSDFSGNKPIISNISSSFHIFNVNIIGDGDAGDILEINPVNGSLQIGGTIDNNGSPLHINGANGRTLILSNIISGSGSFELKGDNIVRMIGANTYTGNTTVSMGVLRTESNVIANTNGALGNNVSGLTLNGGRIETASSIFSRPITITGNASGLDAFGANRTISSPVNMPGPGNFTLNLGGSNGFDLTLSGVISNSSGTLSINKTGSNKVSLSGANTFNGSVTIAQGTLSIETGGSLPTSANIILSSGTLEIGDVAGGSSINAGTFSMTASSTIDLGNASAFTLTFSSMTSTFSGSLNILQWSADNSRSIVFTDVTNLTPAVLSNIHFEGYGSGAQLIGGNILVPASYIFQTLTSGSGVFSNGASWLGGVAPTANNGTESIFIRSGFTLTMDQSYHLRSVDIISGTLQMGSYTLTIGTSSVRGKLNNRGTINSSTSLLDVYGFTLHGNASTTLNNVTIRGAARFKLSPTVNGILQMVSTSSSVQGLSPVYGGSSSLIYNSGGTITRTLEWYSATAGPGYPRDVTLSNNTRVLTSSLQINLGTSRNLTIDAGSFLDMSSFDAQFTVTGNIVIDGQFSMSNTNNRNFNLIGNWTRNNGGVVNFGSGSGRQVYLLGSTNSTITGPAGGETFPSLIINKPFTTPRWTVTLNSPVNVTIMLSTLSGLIRTSSTNLLTLTGCGGWQVAWPNNPGSISSFIDGPMRKIMNTGCATSFFFPVGKTINGAGGPEYHYRPMTIRRATGAVPEYTVEFMRADPHYANGGAWTPISANARAEGLQEISFCEYWNVTRSVGASDVDVELTWSNNPVGKSNCNEPAPYITDASSVVVVPYYNGEWGDQSSRYFGRTTNYGPAINNVSPFLSSVLWEYNNPNGIDTYLKFTIGTTDVKKNPLPGTKVELSGMIKVDAASLSWKVRGNDFAKTYRIQYSNNGTDYYTVYSIDAAIDVSDYEYFYQHIGLLSEVNFYRVEYVLSNGQTFFSNIIRLRNNKIFNQPIVFPNPIIGNYVNIFMNGLKKGHYNLQLVSLEGKIFWNGIINHDGGYQSHSISVPGELTKGIYVLVLTTSDSEPIRIKILK